MCDNRRHPGFTLIELLVVMTLMSVAVGTVIFRLDGITDQGSLRSAAAQLASLYRLAQTQARTRGEPRLIEYIGQGDRILIRVPKKQGGEWGWSKGAEYLTNTGVRIDRILVEAERDNNSGRNGWVTRIRPDGSFRSHAVILERHGHSAVVVFSGTEEPWFVFPEKSPQARSFELLVLELEVQRNAS